MPTYIVRKDLPGLAGLVVRGLEEEFADSLSEGRPAMMFVRVSEIINNDVVVGDRNVRYSLPVWGVLIKRDFLEEVADFVDAEFTVQSPFTEFHFEGHLTKNNLKVDYVKYGNGVSITVSERDAAELPKEVWNTLYSQNFFDDFAVEALAEVENSLRDDHDIEDLILQLKAIHVEAH